jgi:predicted phage tail protein
MTLTTVTLYGPLANKFGRDWKLAVNSPAEAMQLIEANKPGFFNWIRGNLDKYDRYKVIVDYHDGRVEHLDKDTVKLDRTMKRIRFVPIVTGAGGGIGKVILGTLLLVAAVFTFITPGMRNFTPYLAGAGMAFFTGGITELLSPKPKKLDEAVRKDGTSYFFDGPVNTSQQGIPVPLIYGRVLAGSQAISAKVTVDQLLQ